MQHRGMSAETLDTLLEFGRVRHGGGRHIVLFEKKARARLARGRLAQVGGGPRLQKLGDRRVRRRRHHRRTPLPPHHARSLIKSALLYLS